MAGDHNNNHDSHLIPDIISIIVIGMATTACVVTIFHLIVNWLKQQRTSHSPQLPQQAFMAELATAMRRSTENSMVQLLIPAHKYQKGVVEMEGEEDGTSSTCAVCLSEYEEGEELRTLPMCRHSFHVPCIDMWLYSHANCPMCRTPLIFFHAPASGSGSGSGSGGPETQLESSILPDLESPTTR